MKILKVVANHFKACIDNYTISFVPVANKTEDDKEYELNEIDQDLYVFSTLGIIGKNASGKTTAVELLSIVYDIFSNFRIVNSKEVFNYIDKPVDIDVTFYHEGFLYRYKFTLYKSEGNVSDIVLFKNQELYKRKYYKTYAKKLFEYDSYEKVVLGELPEDTSIIYLLLKNIYFRGIYCSCNNIYKNYANFFSIYKLFDNNIQIIIAILKMFDEHIENITMLDDDKFKISFTNKTSREVSNNELFGILSSGTTKGFGLFTFVVYSLEFGCDLIIDEIENHFHKALVENLINLFKDKSINKKNATLIFTTHYCELLDLFNRKDNILISKYDDKIRLENMHEDYDLRPELLKSKKFYENAFNTNVDYDALMNFKKELM